MSFLDLAGKSFLVVGVANKKSIAYHVARMLLDEGAAVVLSVKDESLRAAVAKILPGCPCHVCDLADEEALRQLPAAVAATHPVLHGMVHAVAYASYSEGMKPFHEVKKADFLGAVDISMFSLVSLAGACRELFAEDASVVTLSISTTRMASESYGYMAPIKAALDSAVCFLAKSFSRFSRVRFNAVCPGLLKTSASAGIPGYLESYLYAEQVILRRQALRTEEAASVVVFLLSPRASGINAQGIVVDAGMSINYFDQDLVKKATKIE